MVEKETHKGGMGMAGRKRRFFAKEAEVDVSEPISDLYLSSAKVNFHVSVSGQNFYVSESKTSFYISK